ncbi:MAG: hypothetical protein JNG83_08110 [Opitutaceae bacterium]|nr:hypothetical protein [Opitutaceae bacterium]
MPTNRRQFLRHAGLLSLAAAAPASSSPSVPPPAVGRRGDDPLAASPWHCALELDEQRRPIAGSAADLAAAIRRGADLRIATAFRHNEHIDPASDNPEVIREVADFRVTYLLEDRWTAGLINLRQPVALPDDFGPRPSLSFFLYNQDGTQAIARPYLDGVPPVPPAAPAAAAHADMPRFHLEAAFDLETNAPSRNFIYDFDFYRYWVCDNWTEVLAHDRNGRVTTGSVERLAHEFYRGREVKVAVSGLADELAEPDHPIPHEVIVHCGSCYYYTRQQLFIAATHPLVRVKPAVPLRYSSQGWDFGWLLPRTDGQVVRWLVNPRTLKFERTRRRHALRWFVR